MPLLDIVDQSNNNAVLTPLNGLTGYAHKMSEGQSYYDPYAGARLHAAVEAGLRYVVPYHVIRLNSANGTGQAQWFLRCCARAGYDLTAKGSIVMNDWEGWSDGFATPQQASDFNSAVNDAAGRECVINYGGLPNPHDMGGNIWLADYRSRPKAQTNPLWNRASVWQWGNQAMGGGDTNEILDAAWLDHLAGYTSPPNPPGGTDMPTLLEISGVVTFISPSSGPTHSHASWIWEQAELQNWKSINTPTVAVTRSQLKGIRLFGEIPTGFTAADFYAVIGATGPAGPKGDTGAKGSDGVTGPKGDSGPPGPTPKSATFVY